jgi:hypothetical protein
MYVPMSTCLMFNVLIMAFRWAISALMLTFYIWGRFYGTKKGSPDGSMVLRILVTQFSS